MKERERFKIRREKKEGERKGVLKGAVGRTVTTTANAAAAATAMAVGLRGGACACAAERDVTRRLPAAPFLRRSHCFSRAALSAGSGDAAVPAVGSYEGTVSMGSVGISGGPFFS